MPKMRCGDRFDGMGAFAKDFRKESVAVRQLYERGKKACIRKGKGFARVGNETLSFLSFAANFDFILRDFRYNNDVRAGHGVA